MSKWTPEFYEEDGKQPVVEWLRGLEPTKQRIVTQAVEQILSVEGSGVCAGRWGKALGDGLYEFRIDGNARSMFTILDPDAAPAVGGKVVLRLFFAVYGAKMVLLLGGYDKGKKPSKARQQKEIALARKRLKRWQGQRTLKKS